MADNNFSWDITIEADGNGGEYVLLPEGDYAFTVVKFERATHPGSDKIPACAKAVLTLEVEGPNGQTARCNKNLYVCKKMETMLSDFFRCIGCKKRGERLSIDWGRVMGARGRAHFRPSEWNGRKYNEVAYFIDADAMTEVAGEDVPW